MNLLLQIALNCDQKQNDSILRHFLQEVSLCGSFLTAADINATDRNGRTAFSYVVTNCSLEIVELFLKLFPETDLNRADNEGNTPLHYLAQAGQIDHLNYLLTREALVDIDARNVQGQTPLMKSAIQGRAKCAKLLLLSGADPQSVDNGRKLCAEQWARLCSRHYCADTIARVAKKLYANCMMMTTQTQSMTSNRDNVSEAGALMTAPLSPSPKHGLFLDQKLIYYDQGLRSKLRKMFRSFASTNGNLVAHLTAAATVCASTPIFAHNRRNVAANAVGTKQQRLLQQTVPTLKVCLIQQPCQDFS